LFQDIDYEGFRKFLNSYLDTIDTPDELCRHLFLSFVRKGSRGVDGKAFKVRITFSD
jgi:diacylglycerol kinase (ATP)